MRLFHIPAWKQAGQTAECRPTTLHATFGPGQGVGACIWVGAVTHLLLVWVVPDLHVDAGRAIIHHHERLDVLCAYRAHAADHGHLGAHAVHAVQGVRIQRCKQACMPGVACVRRGQHAIPSPPLQQAKEPFGGAFMHAHAHGVLVAKEQGKDEAWGHTVSEVRPSVRR